MSEFIHFASLFLEKVREFQSFGNRKIGVIRKRLLRREARSLVRSFARSHADGRMIHARPLFTQIEIRKLFRPIESHQEWTERSSAS